MPPPRRRPSAEPADMDKEMARVSIKDKSEKAEDSKKKKWFGF
jgi:hypothetical protein